MRSMRVVKWILIIIIIIALMNSCKYGPLPLLFFSVKLLPSPSLLRQDLLQFLISQVVRLKITFMEMPYSLDLTSNVTSHSYIVLYNTILNNTILYNTKLNYTILYYTIPYYTILHCIAVLYSHFTLQTIISTIFLFPNTFFISDFVSIVIHLWFFIFLLDKVSKIWQWNKISKCCSNPEKEGYNTDILSDVSTNAFGQKISW